MGNACQNGSIFRTFLHKLELPVKGLHDLYYGVAYQNDGSGFDDICLAAFQHGNDGSFQAGNLIFRKLDDEKGFPVFSAKEPWTKILK